MSIGVAILGGGIFAREEHLPAVQAAKALTLKAVYSRSLKSAQTLMSNTSELDLYSDDSGPGKSLDDLLQRRDIQAVIIALPILNQPTYIRKALLAGLHVLSEKPIAENIKDAKELLKWYRTEIDTKKVTWSVAENFRFMRSFDHAAEIRQTLGRTQGFHVGMQTMVAGGKYFETEWRKSPMHQGGFLLDGGVHFIAALRLLLGYHDPVVSLSAYTSKRQQHLPPVDAVDAIMKTQSGATGTVSISFGTNSNVNEYSVVCEKGVVSVRKGVVTVNDDSKEVEEELHKSGVPPEVRAWGEAIKAGEPDPRQIPEQALADLEIIEEMLRSGEADAQTATLKLQTWGEGA